MTENTITEKYTKWLATQLEDETDKYTLASRAFTAGSLVNTAEEAQSDIISAMIENRRKRYLLDQTCTPEFLEWIDTEAPREGVGANEAWNAGYACANKTIAHTFNVLVYK